MDVGSSSIGQDARSRICSKWNRVGAGLWPASTERSAEAGRQTDGHQGPDRARLCVSEIAMQLDSHCCSSFLRCAHPMSVHVTVEECANKIPARARLPSACVAQRTGGTASVDGVDDLVYFQAAASMKMLQWPALQVTLLPFIVAYSTHILLSLRPWHIKGQGPGRCTVLE